MPGRSGYAGVGRDRVFRAVADPVRRAILDQLRAGPRPVHDIAREFPISRPAISRHLRVLRAAHLLSEQRQGRERLYRYEPTPLIALDDWLERHRTSLRRALARLKTHVEKDPSGEEAPDDRAHRSHD
jgi:DNA-binding transcriptional ArsR family regulator